MEKRRELKNTKKIVAEFEKRLSTEVKRQEKYYIWFISCFLRFNEVS